MSINPKFYIPCRTPCDTGVCERRARTESQSFAVSAYCESYIFPNFRRCPALAECVARRAREAPRARRPPRGVAKVLPVYPPKQQRLTITHGYVLASMYIQHLRLLRIVIRLALSRAPHCEALFRPAPSNVFWLNPEFSEKQRYRETRNQKQLSPLATK